MNTQVDSNIMHKSPKAEIILVSMDWQMGKCGIYQSSKLSFGDKKCSDIWYNLDELWRHYGGDRSQAMYSIYLKFPEPVNS